MCSHTRFDKIRNEMIRDKVYMAPIEDKMRENRLKWFGHVKRSIDVPVKSCETINLSKFRRGKGQPKKRWNEVIRHDMNFLRLIENFED